MSKALLIVDMQIMPFIWKDYGGKCLYNENLLLENTSGLINKARKSATPIYYILFTEGEGSPRAKGEPLWQVHPQIAPQEWRSRDYKILCGFFLKNRSAYAFAAGWGGYNYYMWCANRILCRHNGQKCILSWISCYLGE